MATRREQKVIKHPVPCATPECGGTISKRVQKKLINEDGSVAGLKVYCKKCKNRGRGEMSRRIVNYNGRNYTGRPAKELSRSDHEKVGVTIYTGDEAKQFEHLYKNPKELK